jgi:hypothetical protein
MTCTESHLPMHSYLEVDGLELANGARTIQYIRNGLAGDSWSATGGCTCSVLWRELGCDSEEECFVSPAVDPAPWYDAAIPASADYLGILIPDLAAWFDGQAQRNVSPVISGLGGASLGPMFQTPRDLVTSGVLVAASAAGIEYGRRWLQNVMSRLCDPCALSQARIRSHCPPCDGLDDESGEWFVYDLGLTEGIKKTAGGPTPPPGCGDRLNVEFTLLAGNPYLYKRDVTCLAETPLNPDACSPDCIDFCRWLTESPDPVFCIVDPPSIGVLGTVITITSGTGIHNLTVETLDNCAGSAALGTVTGSILIPELPADSTLVIDSSRRKITYPGPADVPMDGTGFISLPSGFGVPWLEIGNCNPAGCISAFLSAICDTDCTPTITIDTRLREG